MGVKLGCLTLREEHRLRVFENRVLSRMFVPERDEVTGERRKLHSEELHNLCPCPNIIIRHEVKENEVGGECERRNVYKVLVGKTDGRRPLRRPRCKSKWILRRLA
jgi:hypothetical protein